jgi:hypothetical protein
MSSPKESAAVEALAVFQSLGEEDYDRIQERIAELTRELDSLQALARFVGIKVGRVQVKPRGPGSRVSGKAAARPAEVVDANLKLQSRRIDVARYIAHAGMTKPGTLIKALSISPRIIGDLLDHPWFARDGERIKLTPEGHRAATQRDD